MTIHRFCGALLISALVAFALVRGPALVRLGGQPTTVLTASQNPKANGGLVLEDPNCGCDDVQRDRPGGPFPTRCRDTNTKQTGTYQPNNDAGTTYPGPAPARPHVYPAGFPFKRFKTTKPGAVPFPGWPAVYPGKGKNFSTWDSTKREAYKNKYEGEPTKDTKPPGKVVQGYCCGPTSNKTGWKNWQIHHILERKHNGTDVDGNMVPMYSISNSKGMNLHNDFTQWWQNIRVDSEFKVGPGLKGDPTVWKHVSKCAVKPWP